MHSHMSSARQDRGTASQVTTLPVLAASPPGSRPRGRREAQGCGCGKEEAETRSGPPAGGGEARPGCPAPQEIRVETELRTGCGRRPPQPDPGQPRGGP